jgi:hypothetical protein
MPVNYKKEAVQRRIKSIEDDIAKAQEYLETGAHAHWHGFRPALKSKIVDGKESPPHKDWVKNVFLPSRERALKKAEKLLDRFE